MSTLTHPALLQPPGPAGRAASLKQVVNQRVAGFFSGLWAVLEEAGQRRAAPHLLHQARRLRDSNPELAASMRALALSHLTRQASAATAAPAH